MTVPTLKLRRESYTPDSHSIALGDGEPWWDLSGHVLYLGSGGTNYAVGGTGTVMSVALTVPSWLSVAGSPVTTSGTLAVTAATGQTANRVLATPDGSTGAVSPRALVANDLPNLSGTYLTVAAAAAGYQPLDATLTALAGVTTAADRLIYATGSDAFATTPFAAAGRLAVQSPLSYSGLWMR